MDEVEVSDHASLYVDSDYESSTDGQRPGRFYGPDSSWRYYTQDERALVASLQQIENNDLSLALFNVHAIRARARGSGSVSAAKSWHSKGRWIQVGQDDRMPFQPPSKWTAWPLKPDLVPRSREVWGVPRSSSYQDSENFSRPDSWKPSLNLQEELKAVLLRQAKDRFSQRHWEDNSPRAVQSGPAARSNESLSILGAEKISADDEQADTASEDAPSEPKSSPTLLFMADDDIASAMLQPTVRHIISRQSALLAVLRRSRQGHRMDRSFTIRARKYVPSGSGPNTRLDGEVKAARKRKRVVSDAFQPVTSTREDHDEIETGPEHTRRPRRQHQRLPGQRDWSEVLGIAAMAGWEPSVIDRATRRCAAIFGETMSMRFMARTSTDHLQDKVIDYTPDMIPPIESPVEEQTGELVEDNAHVCPQVSCRRHYEPYEKRWRLREHLKKSHKYSASQLKDWSTSTIDLVGRNDSTAIDFSGDARNSDARGDIHAHAGSERDDFLQPITVPMGRSRDKRTRASRNQSQSAAATLAHRDDVLGSGSAMSTELEL